MSGGETHVLRRRIRAVIAGAVAAILLAGIAIMIIEPGILGRCKYIVGGEDCPRSHDPDHLWRTCCAVVRNVALGGTLVSVVGAAIGLAGGACRLTFRATAVGAVLFALFAWTAPLVFSSTPEAAPLGMQVLKQVWTLAAGLAVFSICSYAGALVTGKKSDDGQTRLQFSLGEMLLAFAPFAVFMGFIGHFAKK